MAARVRLWGARKNQQARPLARDLARPNVWKTQRKAFGNFRKANSRTETPLVCESQPFRTATTKIFRLALIPPEIIFASPRSQRFAAIRGPARLAVRSRAPNLAFSDSALYGKRSHRGTVPAEFGRACAQSRFTTGQPSRTSPSGQLLALRPDRSKRKLDPAGLLRGGGRAGALRTGTVPFNREHGAWANPQSALTKGRAGNPRNPSPALTDPIEKESPTPAC